jgi:hypothetical protein
LVGDEFAANGLDGTDGVTGTAGTSGNTGSAGSAGAQGKAIVNDGIIDMGRGDDLLDALQGGFGGLGTARMGSGKDTVKGFGTGFFDGGSGYRDCLIIGPGSYDISASADANGYYQINNGTEVMNVKGFESLNGNSFQSLAGTTVTV